MKAKAAVYPDIVERLTRTAISFRRESRVIASVFEQAKAHITALEDRIDGLTKLVWRANGRQLNQLEKKIAATEILRASPHFADRRIAAQFTMSPTTVGRLRKGLEQQGLIKRHNRRMDARGRSQLVTRTAK